MSHTFGHKKSRNTDEQQGGKTHKRFLEQLHEGHTGHEEESKADQIGKHRLKEKRVQHDEADKESEHNRQDALADAGEVVKHTGRQKAHK